MCVCVRERECVCVYSTQGLVEKGKIVRAWKELFGKKGIFKNGEEE